MDRWVGKVAIVTGASAGIGASISEKLVDAGLQVVGLARRVEKVQELANKLSGKKGKLFAVEADMSKEEDIIKAVEWTANNVGPVSILINNAGVVKMSSLTDGSTEAWKQMFDTNVIGLCIATREAFKNMKKNNIDGHIVHINSGLGHKVINAPQLNVYPASKHAVTALTESLRLELNSIGSKTKITSVSPGVVRTEFGADAMKSLSPEQLEHMKKNILNRPALEAGDVADAVMYTLSTPPNVQVHEIMIQPLGAKE